jgi:hypothetical protein
MQQIIHDEAGFRLALVRPTLTIMPDFGGAFCWRASAEKGPEYSVGSCCGLPPVQRGMRKGPHPLSGKFLCWQARFEDAYDGSWPLKLNWFKFHREGISLARLLKAALGDSYCIIYEKPMEDPHSGKQERREVLMDGSLFDLPSRAQLRLAEDKRKGVIPPPPDGKTFEERTTEILNGWELDMKRINGTQSK